jgi:hypothetical protein
MTGRPPGGMILIPNKSCPNLRIDGYVIPAQALHRMVYRAQAGIQFFPPVKNFLDSGFHRSDDFSRDQHFRCTSLIYLALGGGLNKYRLLARPATPAAEA